MTAKHVLSSAELHALFLQFCSFDATARNRTKYHVVSELLRQACTRETCAPSHAPRWNPSQKLTGHDDMCALAVHDLLGGTIMRADIENLGTHYYNQLAIGEDRKIFDMTRCLYSISVNIPAGEPVPYDRLFQSADAIKTHVGSRYERFRTRLTEIMNHAVHDCA